MFKLDLSPSYFAPVSLPLLDADGDLKTHQFDAQFKRLDTEALVPLLTSDAAQTIGADPDALLRAVLIGWRGVKDALDADLPFTPDNLAALLRVTGMRAALRTAYFESLRPEKAAVLSQKN